MIDFLARALSHILVPCFFIGMCGSLVVVAITIVQDMQEVFTEDDGVPAPDKVTGA